MILLNWWKIGPEKISLLKLEQGIIVIWSKTLSWLQKQSESLRVLPWFPVIKTAVFFWLGVLWENRKSTEWNCLVSKEFWGFLRACSVFHNFSRKHWSLRLFEMVETIKLIFIWNSHPQVTFLPSSRINSTKGVRVGQLFEKKGSYWD